MQRGDVMNRCGKTEFLIQKKRKSMIWVAIGAVIILIMYGRGMCREVSFLQESGNMDIYYNADFPPVLNGLLLMLLLISNTFFLFWGIFSIKYDRQEMCNEMRCITFNRREIVKYQYMWAGIIQFYFLLSAAIGYVCIQITVDKKLNGDTGFVMNGMIFWKILMKAVCIFIMAFISLTIGRIIVSCFKNTVVCIAIGLFIDQVLMAKAWLMTGFVYRIFEDNKCFISVGEYTSEEIPVPLVYVIAIGIAVLLFYIMLEVEEKRHLSGKRTADYKGQ